jgi:hypothetical protein
MGFDAKKAILALLLAFIAVQVWNDPAGTAQSFSTFLGDVGGWLEDVLDKGTEFFRNLLG